MESFRGPETQVLRVKPSARLSRSWNPGPESETQSPFIEVLKPRSSEPNTEVLKPNVLRAKCSNAGLQARADCVRPSRVPTSLAKSSCEWSPTHLPHKLGEKTLPITHSMGPYTFLLSSLKSSQIWRSPLVDDRQTTHLPHELEKKTLPIKP
jgi:hypothetical protein